MVLGHRSSRVAVVAATATATALLVGLQPGTAAPSGDRDPGDPGKQVVARALSALERHPAAARAVAGQEFVATASVVDADGTTHVRLERTLHGLRVVGGDLVVHQGRTDAWQGVSQTLRAPLDLGVRPVVAGGDAAATAAAPAAATREISGLRTEGRPELVVDALDGKPRLAWAVTTGGRYDDGTPSRLVTYVDARTGTVLRREEQIHTVDGDGHSLYSGRVPLQVTQSGSSYLLQDATRGGSYTTDMNNRSDSAFCTLFGMGCQTGTKFSSSDASFGNGATSSRESAAVDAQYGTNVTWDYFAGVHGRRGIWGDGRGTYNRVHYGSNYANAFWDGTKMTYGDGDGVEFGPLVSLDVAGHEMTHGVTENTSGLAYSGESGGLNEATSDIFGTMVEFHAANPNDPGDYYIGEEFDLANHEGFRRMDDPRLDGASHSCWTSTTKDVDVHYSSGVGNHFFYLLAEGSGPKEIGGKQHNSPTCDGSTITGIGRADAAQIWFRALTVYMTSGTSYSGARTATLDAARDIFEEDSPQYRAVAAAWTAVNVR